jgi:SAM-dependent methyltransferase
MTTAYVFDRSFGREKERLEIQARMLDPGTERHLIKLGVGPGWRCAEIGAGAGTIAHWLASRVGETGQVVATDVDLRFLAGSETTNLEFRRHDIVAGALRPGSFDLLHTRLVLMHLPARERALRNMIDSIRPGGWLLAEDYDLGTSGMFHPSSPLQERVALAVQALLKRSGADPRYGVRLVPALLAAGLEEVRGEARLEVVRLGAPLVEALALKLEQLKERLVSDRLLTEAEVETAIDEARKPGSVAVHYPPLLVAAWGQRPHA